MPRVTSERLPSGHYFACVIYPNECEQHNLALQYCLQNFKCVYITHRPESEDKKEHVHLLIDTKSRYSVNGIIRFFAGWIEHFELLTNPDAYMRYMLHNTPQAIIDGKTPYNFDELKGDESLKKRIVQNSNFVQLVEMMNSIKKGYTVWEHIEFLNDSGVDSSALLNYIKDNPHFVFSMTNQQINADIRRGNLK